MTDGVDVEVARVDDRLAMLARLGGATPSSVDDPARLVWVGTVDALLDRRNALTAGRTPDATTNGAT